VVQVDVGIHLAELGAQVDVQVTQRAGLVREVQAGLCLVRRDVRRLRLVVQVGVEIPVQVEATSAVAASEHFARRR
jgi:hypothetical protein